MRKFPDILDRTLVCNLAARHRILCRSLAPLLEERRRMGRVRHGHGDLHLTNIAMIDGEAVPFDCLEFSRSEEHTSELQSLMRISYAVFCLKKKTTKIIRHIIKDSLVLSN